jgi:hypothetical protein
MPVARAAFFATRLSPAPVLRIVRFAAFTTFFVLDFLRLAILFPPVRYLVGPSPRLWIRIWKLSRWRGPRPLVVASASGRETIGRHRHTQNCTRCNATCMCRDLFRPLPVRLSGRRHHVALAGLPHRSAAHGGAVTRSRSIANRLYSGSRLLGGGGPKRARLRQNRSDDLPYFRNHIPIAAESQEVHGRESGRTSRLLASNRIEAQSELS